MLDQIAAAFSAHEPWRLAVALLAFFLGGFVKGAVGFALPLVGVTGAASVLPAQTAVAMVILSTVFTNFQQSFRQGSDAFRGTFQRFWPMILITGALIWVGAGLLPSLDERTFFLGLGSFVLLFGGAQLIGWRPRISPKMERPVGVGAGVIAGISGGMSGIWGPPIVLYLTALRVSKLEQIRATGISFLVGALMLTPAHLLSGVLDETTLWLSAAAVAPAYLGMAIGQRTQDKMDLDLFRKLTLVVLLLVAVNLLRRGIFG